MSTLIARVTRDLQVTFHDSVRSATAKGNGAWLIDSAEALEMRCDLSGGEMVTIFNRLVPEDKIIKKFSDRKTACKRLWELLKVKGDEALTEAAKKATVNRMANEIMNPTGEKPKKPKGEKEAKRKSNMDKRLFPADSNKNPYRANTQSHWTYELISKEPGKTFREYAKAGGRVNTIRAAIREQHIRCE